jgi:hypothetical protein
MSVSQKKSKSKASKAAGEPVAPHVRNEGDNTVDLYVYLCDLLYGFFLTFC